MRRLFRVSLSMKVVMLASLAFIPAARAQGNGNPPLPGSGNGAARVETAFQKAELSPAQVRMGRDARLTWKFNPFFALPDGTTITVRLVVNGTVREPPLASDVAGVSSSDGSRSIPLSRVGEGLPTSNTNTSAILRVSVPSRADVPAFDIPLTLLPANRPPVLNGALVVAPEAAGDSNIAVGSPVNVTDPDGDTLRFRIEKHVSTLNRWVGVVAGDALPLQLHLDPSGAAPCPINYKLIVEEVDTSNKLSLEVPFTVTLRALTAGGGPPPASSPPPPAAGAGASTAAVGSVNHSPSELGARFTPNPVRGGEKFVCTWSAVDNDPGDVLSATLATRAATDWSSMANVTSSANTLTGVAPANTTANELVVSIRLTVTDKAGASISRVDDLRVLSTTASAPATPPSAPAANQQPEQPREPAAMVRAPQGDPGRAGVVPMKMVFNPDTGGFELQYDNTPPPAPPTGQK